MKAVLVFDAPESCFKCPMIDGALNCWFIGDVQFNDKQRAESCPLIIVQPGETYQVSADEGGGGKTP